MKDEKNPVKIKKEIKERKIISNEMEQFYERSKKLYDSIQKGVGIIIIKNKLKNINIRIKNKSFCKIFEQAFLTKNLLSHVINSIVNETQVEVGSSTEFYDDNNDSILEIIQSRKDFPVTMAKYMNLNHDEKLKKQIFLKSKSIKEILTKIGPLSETSTYIQISLTQISIEYDSTQIKKEYIINRYKFLLDSRKVFHIVTNTMKKDKKENSEVDKYPMSYYSIKKILSMSVEDDKEKEKYLDLTLYDDYDKKYEKENRLYLDKLVKTGENIEICHKFQKNEKNNIKNILENNVEIKRMKKVGNKEIKQCFIDFEEILNKENKDNNKNIDDLKEKEKLEKIENKKKEIGDAINNRYNRFIEIMHNNKDKKYINLQYLDLMEEFNKKYSKYKIDYYLVKNDRFKDVLIPVECINNYMRYKSEYEKKQFVLVNLNNKENEVQYLVSVNDLKKLYNEWTDLKKEQTINTENPQFEEKKINLENANIVNIGEIKELPEQPDLNKKIKEEKENLEKQKNKGDNKGYIVIRRVIKKKKKKSDKK